MFGSSRLRCRIKVLNSFSHALGVTDRELNARPIRAAVGDSVEEEAAGRLHENEQGLVLGRLSDPKVELEIQLDGFFGRQGIALRRTLSLLDRLQILIGSPQRCERCTLAVENPPNFDDRPCPHPAQPKHQADGVGGNFPRAIKNLHTDPMSSAYQSPPFKSLEHFTNGGPADPEAAAQFRFRWQEVARHYLTGRNKIGQNCNRPIRS